MKRCLLVAIALLAGGCSKSSNSSLPKDVADRLAHLDERLIKPTGNWQVALSGSDFGVAWQVYRAKGTDGGTCISVETTPDLGGVTIEQAADGSATNRPKDQRPLHKGKGANCVYVGDPNEFIADNPESDSFGPAILAVADVDSPRQDGQGPHYAVVVADDKADDIALVLSDDSKLPMSPINGIAFMAWNDSRTLKAVQLTYPGAEPPMFTCTASDDEPILRNLAGAACHNM